MMQNLAITAEMKVMTLHFKPQLKCSNKPNSPLLLSAVKCTTSYIAGKVIDFPFEAQSDTFRTVVVINRLPRSLTETA